MNDKIIIAGNKDAKIKGIQQWHTYEGLLEGLPTAETNGRILADAILKAKAFCGFQEIHLIEPVQKPITYKGEYPFGEPVALPLVVCIARVCYCLPFRDKKKNYSSLGLIWFQDEYAFPIDKDVLEKIKEIPFGKICGEFEY